MRYPQNKVLDILFSVYTVQRYPILTFVRLLQNDNRRHLTCIPSSIMGQQSPSLLVGFRLYLVLCRLLFTFHNFM